KVRRGPLAWFERGLDKTRNGFNIVVRTLIRRALISAAIVVVVFGAAAWFGTSTPTGFIPPEDRGAIFVDVRLPDGAALPRTTAVLAEVEHILLETPGVADVLSVGGYSMLQGTVIPNGAFLIAVL
ncbi:MAG: hydrophobe/amphiphile efflux-1 family RND transporter, partial [Burkholderiales bacterium]|nr:hydrophobe/amphiphile efflux-1 family RND transporter [Burkholderiales bacterium]